MNILVYKECGYSSENKKDGMYFCPNCSKEMNFDKFEAFYIAKPNELHDIN